MGDAHYRTDGGCIIVQMGDAAIDALYRPSCAHYRTDGGRIVVQMGDDTIDALYRHSYAPLSYRWGTHYYPNGGRIVVQMGDASATLGEHTTR